MNRSVVTIKDVARLAGTSIGTVSRILNHRPGASKATHERVLWAIEQLQFIPDPTARALSRAASSAPLIALASPVYALTSPYYVQLRHAVLKVSQQLGFRTLEVDEGDAATARVDAVMFVRDEFSPDLLDRLERVARSVVVIGKHERASWVCIDDQEGMAVITRRLLDLGHQAVAHLGSVISPSIMPRDRARGYQQAMDERQYPATIIELGGGGFELGAYRAIRRAWESGTRFTALTCLCDEAAGGALLALQDLNLRVPQDVSVVGFDGLSSPGLALSTMRQDLGQIARAALSMVGQDLEGRQHREMVIAAQLRSGPSMAPYR